MPRTQLTSDSWQFEQDALAALRTKIRADRRTLGDVYGSPLYGIKTGLNDAFVLDQPTRNRLIASDPKSQEILVPFLRGDDLSKWRLKTREMWLINIPRNKIDIDNYPAIRNHLLHFRERLEKRATDQNWYELQQAQLAYQDAMRLPKIVYPDMSQGPKFSLDLNGFFFGNTVYFIPTGDWDLLALLNSRAVWFYLFGQAEALRGGVWRLRLFTNDVETIPISTFSGTERNRLAANAERCARLSATIQELRDAVGRRMLRLLS